MRNLKKKTINLRLVLFYLCYFLFLASAMLKQVTFLGDIIGRIYQISLVLLLFVCVLAISKMPKKKMMLLYLITILIGLSRLITGNNTLLSLWLFVVASRNIRFERIIKYDLKIRIVLLLLVTTLYFAGMTYVNLHYRNGTVRHSMGFSNPNVFSTHVMVLVAEVIYLARNKLGIKEVILALGGMLLVDHFADSRTQIICLIGILLVGILCRLKQRSFKPKTTFGRCIYLLRKHLFILLMIISLSFSTLYSIFPNNNILSRINSITSGRLSAASSKMEEYNVKLLGQKITIVYRAQSEQTGQKQVAGLDNAYVYFLYEYGIVVTVAMCYFMKKYMEKAERDNRIIAYIMTIFLIGGLMEHFAIEPQLNVFLLYFSTVLYDKGSN